MMGWWGGGGAGGTGCAKVCLVDGEDLHGKADEDLSTQLPWRTLCPGAIACANVSDTVGGGGRSGTWGGVLSAEAEK